MKSSILPLLLLSLTFSLNVAFTQIFVHSLAKGVNDGSSWINAYTNLQDALEEAVDGDYIWVATGTYLPGEDTPSTFLIEKNIQLYGGFAGTETIISERENPAEHPTILSGDLLGDDVEDDFDNHRSDNTSTVVKIGDSTQVVLDGFTISQGHAGSLNYDPTGRGGGLYSRFTQTGTLVLRNCIFTQNYSGRQGAAVFVQNLSHEHNLVVERCEFLKNRGQNGPGLNLSQYGENCSIMVKQCLFEGNIALDNAGGIGYFTSANSNNTVLEIDSCHFIENHSAQFSGSGILAVLFGASSAVELKHSSFLKNSAGNFGTVAIWPNHPNASGNVEVAHCILEDNQASYSAGLSWGSFPNVGGEFIYSLTHSDFIGNHATLMGGAMDFYGEAPSIMTIDHCNFIDNSAGDKGGAILAVTNYPDFVGLMRNCVLENNSSPSGAAIVANDFTEESGQTQLADFTFDNCLMTGNNGGGGTIELYNIGTVKFLNCTIADNPAGGILQNQNSSLALQNTLLSNPEGSTEYTGASGSATVNSLGGNLVRDGSMNNLLGDLDQLEIDPGFIPESFEPSAQSPLINAGVNDGVTAEFDLAGNDRIQHGTVDIGAFESPFLSVGTREVATGALTLSPNPASDYLHLQFPERSALPIEVQLFDSGNKLVKSLLLDTNQTLGLQDLAAGLYIVKATVKKRIYVGKFMKQ